MTANIFVDGNVRQPAKESCAVS